MDTNSQLQSQENELREDQRKLDQAKAALRKDQDDVGRLESKVAQDSKVVDLTRRKAEEETRKQREAAEQKRRDEDQQRRQRAEQERKRQEDARKRNQGQR